MRGRQNPGEEGMRKLRTVVFGTGFMGRVHKPRKSIETFAAKRLRPTDYDQVEVRTEDFGAMLFRMGPPTSGSMMVSQVAGGRKNQLFLEIYGYEPAIAWNAKCPDMLWVGHRNSPNELVITDPTLLMSDAHTYADLPGGHSEGFGID